jgi:hypothetical protein
MGDPSPFSKIMSAMESLDEELEVQTRFSELGSNHRLELWQLDVLTDSLFLKIMNSYTDTFVGLSSI